MTLLLRFLPHLMLAAALAGACWYVNGVFDERDSLLIRTQLLEDAKARAESASQALTAQLQAQEAANAQRDRDYRQIAAALRAGQDARRAARAADPVLRAWADTPHPASVAAGLRDDAGEAPAGVPVSPAPGEPATAD